MLSLCSLFELKLNMGDPMQCSVRVQCELKLNIIRSHMLSLCSESEHSVQYTLIYIYIAYIKMLRY